ncbi:MAG: histidine phosphatase family protein [Novosphingobium sp.]
MYVIVRHGNTFAAGETPRRIGARTDLPLTDKGIEQARALGTLFARQGLRFTRVLVSPLLRTRQTATEIVAALELSAEQKVADFLREIDHGPDENLPEDEVLARIGAEALAAWEHQAIAPPGWTVDAQQRIAAWWSLFAEQQQEMTLLVTSNGAARFALMSDPALSAAAMSLSTLKLPTGGFGVVERKQDGALNLACWGERP